MRMLAVFIIAAMFPVASAAQAPFTWQRVAWCLPDMREAPTKIECSAEGAVTQVARGRYVLIVVDGTAHIRQGQTTCTADDAAWVDGTQVPVDEGLGSQWCCMSSDAARVQLVRCK